MSDWSKNAQGNVTVRPLTGYATALFAKIGCVLRVTYLLPGPRRSEGTVQLAMTSSQARELGQALLKMADQADQQDLGPRM